jgi:hypothetical protein
MWSLKCRQQSAVAAHLPTCMQDQSYGASPAEVPRDSVYALGMNADGTLLASGSTEVRPRCPLRLLCPLLHVGPQLPARWPHRCAVCR